MQFLIVYRTTPHHTIPYHTIPYHTIPYHTTRASIWSFTFHFTWLNRHECWSPSIFCCVFKYWSVFLFLFFCYDVTLYVVCYVVCYVWHFHFTCFWRRSRPLQPCKGPRTMATMSHRRASAPKGVSVWLVARGGWLNNPATWQCPSGDFQGSFFCTSTWPDPDLPFCNAVNTNTQTRSMHTHTPT